ncbi:hypothetical protein [Streptomyces sp. Ncost-T10-10d]|uniref:hypothetical protein n=1 Tax=Streptomyces sp. Ncost-T10-10d TaxID=1839774 RepID=UPI00114D026B|nr:hypothetical protein [Streptomyces sp. Ncost-T10-10d]
MIGINTYKRLDPQENKEGKNTIRAAMAGIDQPNRLRMAAMGFTWTPSWEHISKGRVPLAEVRQAYQKLSDAEKRQAIAANESNWRDGKKLPYGIFLKAVLGSSHTAAGERFPGDEPEDLRRSHRAYALVMQSQTTARAMNLAREFRKENPRPSAAPHPSWTSSTSTTPTSSAGSPTGTTYRRTAERARWTRRTSRRPGTS